MKFPKLLIFGQTFNYYSGGGITLSNLFKGWPKHQIAVAATGNEIDLISTDICNTYYQLGEKEYYWKFPFNLIRKTYSSGVKNVSDKDESPIKINDSHLRYYLVNELFFPLMEWLGLNHYISKISMSKIFKDWLAEFKPEILYFQVASRETILFATELAAHLKLHTVVHIMDDWPSTISNKGPFKKYWGKKIDKEFRELLDLTNVFVSISHAMSEEYLLRYNKNFVVFHNPIELKKWLPFSKTNYNLSNKSISILYSGRIGYGITESLIDVAMAVDKIRINGIDINFYIQTPNKHEKIYKKLKKYNCVIISPFAEYTKLPEIFSQADILLLSNDFDNKGLRFLKYSMPTKLPEYMISGTPILVYSPGETAVSKFIQANECGFCVHHRNITALEEAIYFLISNERYRKKISKNAIELAKEKFNAERIRNQFNKVLFPS